MRTALQILIVATKARFFNSCDLAYMKVHIMSLLLISSKHLLVSRRCFCFPSYAHVCDVDAFIYSTAEVTILCITAAYFSFACRALQACAGDWVL